jgi:hypothetical protein
MTSQTGSFNAVAGENPTSYLNQNQPSNVLLIRAQRAPKNSDRRQKIGTLWVDQTTDQTYQLTTVSAGAANWTLLGPGASDVDTLTGDSGGAISPSGGNITLAGGSNITSSGSGSTITFALDNSINVSSDITTGELDVDNININGNTISSTDTNGNINLSPDGTGVVATSKADINGGNIDGTTIGGSTPAAGNFTTVDASGNISLSSAATQLQVTGGAVTDFIGTATLSSGTVTVANTNIAANDHIFLTYQGTSISDSGQLSYTISAGTSFTIESTNASDANDVSYFIVREL